MARRKTSQELADVKRAISGRLALLRAELYGDRGAPALARQLGIPVRTWYNYEGGITVPGEILLKLIELTSVEPSWLLSGEGPPIFRHVATDPSRTEAPVGASVVDLLMVALRMLEDGKSTFGPRRGG